MSSCHWLARAPDSKGFSVTPFRGPLLLMVAVVLTIASPLAQPRAQSTPPWLDRYREVSAHLIGAALSDTFAWQRLAFLTDTIGHRLSGSPQLDRAIEWAAAEMKRDGLENVHTEKVIVPHWVRGTESADILEPARHVLVMLGLGNSVGTRAEGVQREVVAVRSFNDLQNASTRVKGRIVLFNVPYTSYEETLTYRTDGASRAAKLGAAAVLVRAVGPPGLRTPHTGSVQYGA